MSSRILLSLLTIIATILPAMAQKTTKPDFAFPAKVVTDSRSRLNTALDRNNGPGALRALLNMTVALNEIDPDSATTALAKCRTAAERLTHDGDRAMVYLLQAQLYASIYRYSRHTYDERTAPASDTYDYHLWSGAQMCDTIYSLVDRAMSHPERLAAIPSSRYKSVITLDANSLQAYPSLLDIVAWQSTQLLSRLGEIGFISPAFLTPNVALYYSDTTLPRTLTTRILGIYADWMKHSPRHSTSLFNAELQRTKFVAEHLYRSKDTPSLFEPFISLWEVNRQLPSAAEALITADDYILNTDPLPTRRRYLDACRDQIKAHPKYFRNPCLRRIIDQLTTPSVEVSTPKTLSPTDSLRLTVVLRNATHATIDIYSVPWEIKTWNRHYQLTAGNLAKASKVTSIEVSCDSTRLPFDEVVTRSVKLPGVGTYIAVPMIQGQKFLGESYPIIHCTDISLISSSLGEWSWALAINPLSGSPIKDVTVNAYRHNRTLTLIGTAKTDAAGFAKLPVGTSSIFAVKGADRFAPEGSGVGGYWPQRAEAYAVAGLTDLALYHPGDTVGWSAVAQSIQLGATTPLSNRQIHATLFDVNSQPVDSTTLTTDEFGRVAGRFTLPTSGLTGNYSIRFDIVDKAADVTMYWSEVSFKVADYTLPAYRVEISDVERDIPSKGAVTIKGKALTYTGFPVSGARVATSLTAMSRSFFNRFSASFATIQGETAADGSFTIVCTPEMLAQSPLDDAIFSADITVTSPSGENREASTRFTLGRQYTLLASLPDINVDATSPLRPNILLSTIGGEPRTAPLRYTLFRTDSTVAAEGDIVSGLISVGDVASGVYSLTIATADTSLAYPARIERVVLYRPTDTATPDSKSLLWTPKSEVAVAGVADIDLLYATSAEESHVLYTITAADSIVARGWLVVPAGMHHFRHSLPASIPSAHVTLLTINRYNSGRVDVDIVRPTFAETLDIAVESFRDRIAPGARESWRFRVTAPTTAGSFPRRAALMLDVYNSALDDVTPHRFIFTPQTRNWPSMNWDINLPAGSLTAMRLVPGKSFNCTQLSNPDFLTWDRPLFSGPRFVFNFASRNLHMPMPRRAATPKMVDDDITEETAYQKVEHSQADYDAGSGTTTDAVASTEKYREPVNPSALFAPMLTTEPDGTLCVDFTAPDANASWTLRAIAYDSTMTVGTMTRTLTVARPLMVRPDLPAFLRSGDSTLLPATVINATDSAMNATTTVELFDPATGQVLSNGTFPVALPAQGATVVRAPFTVPEGITLLGFRVKSRASAYTDGEQTVIPILPASQPVVESKPYYMQSDSTTLSLRLPAMSEGAQVTLQFCENPAWYLVTALPGIASSNPRDALSASAAIFSAAVAQGIMAQQPIIADALHQWSEADSSAALTSMLERNPSLKTLLLSDTPWVADARSQSERMSRLALLLDQTRLQSLYISATEIIKSLQTSDGGFSWTAASAQSSLWITQNVLLNLGSLRQLGFLPTDSELSTILDRALRYLDAQAEEFAHKNPKETDALYLYICDLFPARKLPAACRSLNDRTVDKLNATWRELPLGSKAAASLILRSHGHAATSRLIVESILDHAVSSPQGGLWFPSLDRESWWSMSTIGTTALILEAVNPYNHTAAQAIRQWLLLQKEARDWGNSVTTSSAIAAILTTGPRWTLPSSPVVITLDGKRLPTPQADSYIGEVSLDLSPYNPSGKLLTINKSSSAPSWGAVVARYTAPMADIAALSTPELSISKTLYRRVDTPTGTTWVEVIDGRDSNRNDDATVGTSTDSIAVGDVVRTVLTINSLRDIDYVVITDNRAAALQPIEQLPTADWADGLLLYREPTTAVTNLFITRLPRGTYRIAYDLNVTLPGTFASGIATIQSQYAPTLSAHSAATPLHINP